MTRESFFCGCGGGEEEKKAERKREGGRGRRKRSAGVEVISLTPLPAFVSPGAARPGTPARGLLHDSPLDTRVQGLRPLTPVAADIL